MKCFLIQVVEGDALEYGELDESGSAYTITQATWQALLRAGGDAGTLAVLNHQIEVKCGVCGSFSTPAKPFFEFLQNSEPAVAGDEDSQDIFQEVLRGISQSLIETKFNDEEAFRKYWQDGGGDHRLLKDRDGDLVYDELTGWPLGLAYDDVAVMTSTQHCQSCSSLFLEGRGGDTENNSEALKPLPCITEPDPRNSAFARFDPQINDFRPITLEEHHADIAQFSLASSVPEKVAVHFETAKNLYLYAWFVYRFYPVADLHAKTTLEFALRERIGEEEIKKFCKSKKMSKGLKCYILYAIERRWVSNEGFRRWHERARVRAEERTTIELIEKMRRENLREAVFDPSQAVIKEEDKAWDFLEILSESIPAIRNKYAHGSSMLHNQVLGAFELVSEFINQLWPSPHQGE